MIITKAINMNTKEEDLIKEELLDILAIAIQIVEVKNVLVSMQELKCVLNNLVAKYAFK